jgi:type II secretory pathway component PulF
MADSRHLPQQLRRLAALASNGQAWSELPPELSAEYQGWLEAARHSNHPEPLLLRLAAYCQSVQSLRSAVARSLLYPRLVLLGLCLVILGLLASLAYLQANSLSCLLLLGLLVISALAFQQTRGADWVRAWLGSRRQANLEQVLWCGNLAHLLDQQLDLPRACGWAALAVRHPRVKAQALALEENLRAGSSLGQSLERYDWDPLIGWAASAGEEHQTLAAALHEAARVLETNLREEMGSTLAWLQPAALALIGGLVMLTLAVFWLNYQSISLETLR